MIKDTTHYHGRYLDMVERNGWEFTHRSNATGVVVLVAVTKEHELLLVEQYRPPVDAHVIELPAGLVGDDDGEESLLDAAARELEEETGYTPGQTRIVLDAPSSAGMTSEIITFVAACDLVRTGPGGGIDNENIRVHAVPLDGVDEWLDEQRRNGKPLDPKIFAALYWISRGRLEMTDQDNRHS